MSWHAWFTIGVVVCGIVALLRDLLAPDLIFLAMLAILLAGGILSPQEAFEGFANPEVIAIGALFVVAGALQSTGALGFVASSLLGGSADGRKALVRLMVPVAAISAFLNNTPIVAMFTPVVLEW
ncbi:MAG: SLC13 family permease, partial [Candidatus Binatia bacterium]|nr:SLC13 family permease [Candidatus Binatia bacterium]